MKKEDAIVNIQELKNMTKGDLIALGKEAAQHLTEDGYNDAAPLIIAVRKVIEYLNSLSRNLESLAIDEISAQDNNEVTAYGSVISMGSTGDRLNYKLDPVWSKLTQERTEREKALKFARTSGGKVIGEDGETVPKLPLSGAAKTVVRVKL